MDLGGILLRREVRSIMWLIRWTKTIALLVDAYKTLAGILNVGMSD